MKSLLPLFFLKLLISIAPVFAEDKTWTLNGTALECRHGKLPVTISYWIFDGVSVYKPTLKDEPTPRMEQGNPITYVTKENIIQWKLTGPRSIHYSLDKRTLTLQKKYRSRKLTEAECEKMPIKELEAKFQEKIDR